MANPDIPHLGDLPELNDIAPKHPKLNGNDGFQNAHILGQSFWQRDLSGVIDLIDPNGTQLNPNMASNVVHAPETKAGGMATGQWVHLGQQQAAFDASKGNEFEMKEAA